MGEYATPTGRKTKLQRSTSDPPFDRDIESIAVNLLQQADASQARVLSLIGTGPGHGVTTLCLHVALEMAKSGRQVVVVDCHHERPSIHHIAGIARSPGLLDVLSGDVELDAALVQAHPSGVCVLPIGTEHAQAPGAFSDEVWRERVISKRSTETIWVRDAGTVNTPGTPALAMASDGVCLVIQAGAVSWEAAESHAQALAQVRAPVWGVILNKRRMVVPSLFYRSL